MRLKLSHTSFQPPQLDVNLDDGFEGLPNGMFEDTMQPTVEGNVVADLGQMHKHLRALKVHVISEIGMYKMHGMCEGLLEPSSLPTLVVPIVVVKDVLLNAILHVHDFLINR